MNSFNAEELEPGWKVKVEEALVKGTEWTQLDDPPNEDGETFNIKNEHLGFQESQYLGLHESGGFIRPSHFVGTRWLDSTTALIVDSKFSENNVDTVLMFSEVLELEGNISEGLFECYPEEKTIPGQPLQENISLLQIAVFLKELAQFCQRDLRMGFIPIQENLTGKVKGRVLVSEQIRRNLTRGRIDRTVCAFTIISMDTLPNQILRWALHLCLRYLARVGDAVPRVLWNWGRISESALSGVRLIPVHTTDFRGLIYAGFMRRYRHPHALARMIIARLHIDPGGEVMEKGTVPFYLNMNQLFERYVGVKLRTYFKNIDPQKSLSTPKGENQFPTIGFRPDYVCRTPNEVWIIDAKYKRYFSESGNQNSEISNQSDDQLYSKFEIECKLFSSINLINADIYQALAYATMWPNQTNENNKRRVNVTVLAVPTTEEMDFEKIIRERTFPKVNLDVFNEHELCLGILPIPLPKKRST